MSVLVDTPIWSLALRRKASDLRPQQLRLVETLAELIGSGQVQLLGVVRQELLSGIREEERFRKLRELLRSFEDPPLESGDYEEAAHVHNLCSAKGIAGSAFDFLICAVAHRRNWQVFTTDLDFQRYAGVSGVRLYVVR